MTGRSIVAVLLAGAMAHGAQADEVVHRAEFGDDWPFAFDEMVLRCKADYSVVFEADGVEYAVNGVAASKGYADADTIVPVDMTEEELRVSRLLNEAYDRQEQAWDALYGEGAGLAIAMYCIATESPGVRFRVRPGAPEWVKRVDFESIDCPPTPRSPRKIGSWYRVRQDLALRGLDLCE